MKKTERLVEATLCLGDESERHQGIDVERVEPVDALVENPKRALEERAGAVEPSFKSFEFSHRRESRRYERMIRADRLLLSLEGRLEVPPGFFSLVREHQKKAEIIEIARLVDKLRGHQMRDLLGVLKVQRGRLDLRYMTVMTRQLGLEELLAQARAQSGLV